MAAIPSLLEDIPLAKIILEQQKYRHFDLDEYGIEKLTLDIKNKGLLVPVLVWRKEDENFLVSGYHRFECAKRLGWKTIPARIMFFNSENQAIEASIQTNAQDQYTFARRSWFKRFCIAEEVLRDIYEERAKKRQTSGKKVENKYRVDELLARGVGLSWSYVKYAQMRKIYDILKDANKIIEPCIPNCMQKMEDPKIQLWLEVLEMKKKDRLPKEDWQKFTQLCEHTLEKENILSFSEVDNYLRYLRKAPFSKKTSPKEIVDHCGTLYIAWKDKEGEHVLAEIKKLCREKNWDIKVEGKTKKEVDTYSQKIVFSVKNT